MKNAVLRLTAIGLVTASLTACIGQMGVSRMLLDANLKVADNRYVREGLFFLLTPIYGITLWADTFIFNSIEFWTGKNPLTDERPLADSAAGSLVKINQKINKEISTAASDVNFAKITRIDENTLEMSLHYTDGTVKKLRGEKQGNSVNFYLNNEFITTASLAELQAHVDERS